MPSKYVTCSQSDIPPWVRWDIPPQNQGQPIEVAYASGGPDRTPAVQGDAYCRMTDRSSSPVAVTYLIRSDVEPHS